MIDHTRGEKRIGEVHEYLALLEAFRAERLKFQDAKSAVENFGRDHERARKEITALKTASIKTSLALNAWQAAVNELL